MAAAAASAHSVTGAFGYTLGQAPVPRSAECRVLTQASSQVTNLSCPGQGGFSRIGVNARRNQVTDISGFRQYPATRPDAALRTCLADLARLKAGIRREHPELHEAPPQKFVTFQFSEQMLAGRFASGRSINGYCDPRTAHDARGYVLLWVAYLMAAEERVRLIKAD